MTDNDKTNNEKEDSSLEPGAETVELSEYFEIEMINGIESIISDFEVLKEETANEELAGSIIQKMESLKDHAVLSAYESIETIVDKLGNLIQSADSLMSKASEGFIREVVEVLKMGIEIVESHGTEKSERIVMDTMEKMRAMSGESAEGGGPFEDDGKEKIRTRLEAAKETIRMQSEGSINPNQFEEDADNSADENLISIFKEEANGYVRTLKSALEKLDYGIDDLNSMRDIRKASHSLKGSARLLGFEKIGDLAAIMEKIIDRMIDDGLEFHSGFQRMYSRAVGLLKKLLERDKKSESKADGIIEKLTNLESLLTKEGKKNEFKDAEKKYDLKEEIAETIEEVEKSGEEPVFSVNEEEASTRIAKPVSSDETREIFFVEAMEHIERLNNDLLGLEKDPDNIELIDQIMRNVHTLKGSAAILKYDNMSKLAHGIEDVLQLARDNRLRITGDISDLLFKAVDVEESLVKSIEDSLIDHSPEYVSMLGKLGDLAKELKARVRDKGGSAQLEHADTGKDGHRDPDVGKLERSVLRVDVSRLNSLMNLIGELAMCKTSLANQIGGFKEFAERLDKQKSTMKTSLRELSKAGAGVEGHSKDAISDSEKFVEVMSDLRNYNRIASEIVGETEDFEGIFNYVDRISGILDHDISKLSTIANELQDETMKIRLLPLEKVFGKFQRLVRDLAKDEGKLVSFVITGERTELDKTVVDEIDDSLMHLIRNAVSHGIEMPEERRKAGKEPKGTIAIGARQEGDQVVIEVEDDGRGIDLNAIKEIAGKKSMLDFKDANELTKTQLLELIFEPGITTFKEATGLSGRGVGLDVVKTSVVKLQGSVDVESEAGKGTRFTLRLPLTLAITKVLMVRISGQQFAIPLSAISETLNINRNDINTVASYEVVYLRNKVVPLLYLDKVLDLPKSKSKKSIRIPVVIVKEGTKYLGLVVDELLGGEEIAIRNLGKYLGEVDNISGATILGDGHVVLILDAHAIINSVEELHRKISLTISSDFELKVVKRKVQAEEDDTLAGAATVVEEEVELKEQVGSGTLVKPPKKQDVGKGNRVLIVDDSVSVSKFVGKILERAGYEISVANDGLEALGRLTQEKFDLVMTDLEMPRMSGYKIISQLKTDVRFQNIPVVILSARTGEKYIRKGTELGADAFVVKPFREYELIQTVRELIG